MDKAELCDRERVEQDILLRKGKSVLSRIEFAEKALGITLTPQQMGYIAMGRMRRTGKTTAHIIAMLLDDAKGTLDFRNIGVVRMSMDECFSGYDRFFKEETLKIYRELKRNGIKVREVLF